MPKIVIYLDDGEPFDTFVLSPYLDAPLINEHFTDRIVESIEAAGNKDRRRREAAETLLDHLYKVFEEKPANDYIQV